MQESGTAVRTRESSIAAVSVSVTVTATVTRGFLQIPVARHDSDTTATAFSGSCRGPARQGRDRRATASCRGLTVMSSSETAADANRTVADGEDDDSDASEAALR